MSRSKWFLALGSGLVSSALALGAAPQHGHAPARPAGGMSHPVAHPVQPRPQPQFQPRPQPQILPTGGRPVVNNLGLVQKPVHSGPMPLLTNPHPTATGPKPVSHVAPIHHNAVAAANTAAVAASLNAGRDPASIALFLYSQRNSHNGWGWGWGGYYGYSPFGFYGMNPFGFIPWGYGYGPGFGIGFGYQSGPWSFGLGYNFGYSPVMTYVPYAVPYASPVVVAEANPPLIPQAETTVLPTPTPTPIQAAKPAEATQVNFAERGQEQFLAGNYAEAAKTLRHAVLDDPRNGPLLALTGEALWANGSFNEAAGAIQQSLLATPETDWPAVANRAARLIPADAVGKLANALNKDANLPELRFLAAYQSFGAGKYQEAAAHLDLLLKSAKDDQVAKKLRDQAMKLADGK